MSVSVPVSTLLSVLAVGYAASSFYSCLYPPPPRFQPCNETEAYGFLSVWACYRPSLLFSDEHRSEWKSRERPNEAVKKRMNNGAMPHWYRGYLPLNEADYNALDCPVLPTSKY
jgi:hypothetical protein